MQRRQVIVEFATPPLEFPRAASREERFEALRQAAQEAKGEFVRWLEELRRDDPRLNHHTQDDINPIVFVETTEQVIEKFRTSDKVVAVEDRWVAGVG